MKIAIRQKEGMNYLYADISVSGIRVKSTLGISVKLNEFNPKTQTVKGGTNHTTNVLIQQMKTEIMDLVRCLQKDGDLNRENIKQGLEKLRSGTTDATIEKANDSLVLFATEHIQRTCELKKGATIRHIGVTLNKLKAFEKHTKSTLTFDNVDMKFYDSFVSYCTTIEKLSVNTIGSHVKNVKMWMNSALLDGLHTNTVHQHRAFKKVTEESDTIYLNENDIKRLIDKVLPSERLEQVRDLFVLACYTGVRIQDYKKLNRFHLVNDGTMFKIRTEKTGAEVIIPLHVEAKKILMRYNGTPKVISNQKFNTYLKELCRFVGIDELVQITRTIAGKRTTSICPKHELVSSHTARRSFATNAYKAGVPTLAIMAITGHTTEKVFLRYVRVSKEEHASLVSQHGFFKGNVA